MANKISRRDFIKWSGIGAAASVLTGCGPAARYVNRRPYAEMPEYNHTGQSTYFATTCRECPAGCGVIVRTIEGRAIKVEGNPAHPVSRGKICSRGLTAVQGLYNPDRIQRPRKYSQRGADRYEEIDWDASVAVIKEALQSASVQDTVFLLGAGSDHVFDFVAELSAAAGLAAPVRYSVSAMMDDLRPLLDAVEMVYARRVFPYFDVARASLVLSFGSDLLASWLSPVAYSRMYAGLRSGEEGRRGALISFEPHLSLTSANADQWFPIPPGSQGLVARAIGSLVVQKKGLEMPRVFSGVDLAATAELTGISQEGFQRLADLFASASHPLAIPGGADPAGVGAVLELNHLAGNSGQPGGVFLTENDPSLSSAAEIKSLIERMGSGAVKTLFIHGVNPLFDLPAGWGFADALAKVPRVISFSPYDDETALASDFVFPDHTALESWGYQKNPAGADRSTWSGSQPAVSRLYDTRATIDVFLAAAAAGLPYKDEVEFIQAKITPLIERSGFYSADNLPSFWAQWLQHGGWWSNEPDLQSPPMASGDPDLPAPLEPPALGENQFHLIVTPTNFGDGSGANRPWLQETPHYLTTAVWGSWVEINPQTAARLGIKDDDIVKIESAAGAVEAPAYLFPALRPDCVAIPFGQGHTALGRYAAGRGVNPTALLGSGQQAASNFIFAGQVVTLTATGKTRQLARAESREGVYDRKPDR